MIDAQIPISVDSKTGVWSTDNLPMLYVPRHFFMNNHFAINAALGAEKHAQILHEAGYKSAYYWCEHEAKQHQLSGLEVFQHYLKRLSQRGWGQFSLLSEDVVSGNYNILVANSAFVLHCQAHNIPAETKLCSMFAGWFAGAADWLATSQGLSHKHQSQEESCGAHKPNQEGCRFKLSRK